MKSLKNILLLDTDQLSADQIMNTLSIGKDSFTIQHAGGVTEGLNYLQSTSPDLVLLDGKMVESGEFTAVQSKLSEQHIPCILLSETGGAGVVGLAEKSGAREYVVKSGITPSHLLKTIVNTLKLSETESRLNLVFEEYSARIASFSVMLDALHIGAVVVSKDGAMQYANEQASAMMKHAEMNKILSAYTGYRQIENESSITIQGAGYNFTIHTKNIAWNNESCNLFLIEASPIAAVETTESNPIAAFMNTQESYCLLLKDDVIEYINPAAAQFLLLGNEKMRGEKIGEILSTAGNREVSDTTGKSVKGIIKSGNGISTGVKYIVGSVNIAGNDYLLLSFAPVQVPQPASAEIAGGTASVSESGLGNFNAPAQSLIKDLKLMVSTVAAGNYAQATELAKLADKDISDMSALLAVYKNYMAITDHAPVITEFSMKDLVNEVLAGLKSSIDETGAEVNISELPHVKGDAEMVRQVIEQLITNALQFKRENKQPVIDFGHDKYEGSYIFCIRDNGVGIARKDHVKIFEPFEKLEPGSAGNGLGLAICKTIVEKQGGKIWVESLPGHGSNFYFTLS